MKQLSSIVVLVAFCGCERDDVARVASKPATATPVRRAAPGVVVPQPEAPKLQTDIPIPSPPVVPTPRPPNKATTGRRIRIRDEADLPAPPSDEPAEYTAWYRALPHGTRAEIDAFCRREGWNYHLVCGGIGPQHIPVPPSLVPIKGGPAHPRAEHDAWLASLTAPQRHYYTYWCIEHTDEGKIGYSQLCGATPLVAQFDPDAAIDFVAGGVDADATPWLALDRDHDGAITRAGELFGDGTPLPDGSLARNGFEALAQYDANHDGRIDRADPIYAELSLWNGVALTPLASRITSIELANHRVPRCTRFGCEGERSIMATASGGAGAIVDVYVRRGL